MSGYENYPLVFALHTLKPLKIYSQNPSGYSEYFSQSTTSLLNMVTYYKQRPKIYL